MVKDATAKPGSWKGTFRFQGAHALKLGSRYWYYYIVDGYHVSHDPAKEHVIEKTTGRKLNVLNVPAGKTPVPSINTSTGDQRRVAQTAPKTPTTARQQIPHGRALSPGKIAHPKPQKPYASRGLREADYDMSPIDDLEDRLGATHLSDRYASSPSELSESSESSGTVFSKSSGASSSATSDSDSGHCRCNRFGLTRDGRRVMLDCGGKRCGYASSDSSECGSSEASDSSEEDDEEEEAQREAELRRRARARLEAERARNGVKTTVATTDPRSRHVVATTQRRR